MTKERKRRKRRKGMLIRRDLITAEDRKGGRKEEMERSGGKGGDGELERRRKGEKDERFPRRRASLIKGDSSK